ncbi:hypothetical protein QE152_g27376 [Popillia japonica]|uniref:Uncharacterized protein n=1 Tax=Popillia japonica TaxID=7064 RepID=A0AAW1JVL6_POPJA
MTRQVKFLEVQLGSKLDFKDHINQVKRKANIMKCLAGVTWGADLLGLLSIYHAMVRSHIDYAVHLIPGFNRVMLESLQRIQNAGLRIAVGAMRSTPVVALHAEACVLPISYRLQFLTANFVVKPVVALHAEACVLPISYRLQFLTANFVVKHY